MQSLTRDGIALCYQEIAGAGSPVLLMHGWCCDHSYLAPQAAHYAAKGHRVIAPDLRGHGQSDKLHQDYSIAMFTGDVVWLCGELGVEKPIVIGHSMGGVVAWDMAAGNPDFVRSMVLIDAALALPAAARAGFSAVLEKLRGPDYQDVLRAMAARERFTPVGGAERRAAMIEQMVAMPQHVIVAAFASLCDYDANHARGVKLPPTLYIASGASPPRGDAVQLRDIAPAIEFEKLADTGHFCQLEKPDEVNAIIDRFLRHGQP